MHFSQNLPSCLLTCRA